MATPKYTTKSGFTFWEDPVYDYSLSWENAKTLERYKEICEQKRNYKDPCIFWAFSKEQFEEGMARVRPHLKEGQKIVRGIAGMFCTREAYDKMMEFYRNADKMIAAECDPQEVYCYEYNNHECCINWDGDLEPMRIVRVLFGKDVKVRRFRACEE